MPLSPSSLLTLRDDPHPAPPESFNEADLLAYGGRRWRRVQYLSDQFWTRWRRDYLQTLQARRKWTQDKTNLKPGDLVLLRDKTVPRNLWPFAIVEEVKKSSDDRVRSARIKIVRHQKNKKTRISSYERPISELVLLVPS